LQFAHQNIGSEPPRPNIVSSQKRSESHRIRIASNANDLDFLRSTIYRLAEWTILCRRDDDCGWHRSDGCRKNPTTSGATIRRAAIPWVGSMLHTAGSAAAKLIPSLLIDHFCPCGAGRLS
jgi:hypothetical protein